MQVLPIDGQNDANIDELSISDEEFEQFVEKHRHLSEFATIIPELNSQMTGSYVMIDPAGRFFDNTAGKYHYSQSILAVGTTQALTQVCADYNRFMNRNGMYNWATYF